MSPAKRLRPVKRIAENREKGAARELGHSQKELEKQIGKLDELRSYHEEYLERFTVAAHQGMGASQMVEYRAFLTKLDAAIKQQQETVESTRKAQLQKKQAWQQKRSRNQALGKAVDKLQLHETREADKRDQKVSDDRNNNRRG